VGEYAQAGCQRLEATVATAERPLVVLYVEDNPLNVTLVERVLALIPQVTLLVAPDGSRGLELAREAHLVLLDLNLPDMKGDEVLRRLRADSETAGIPVVILSADLTQEDRLRAAGANGYLVKPYDINALIEIVDQHRPHDDGCDP
jgi:CheY-like chemotaxis protein